MRRPDEPHPLFIAHKEKGIGIIMAAEKRYAKSNGHPYIWVTVDCGGADQISCVINRAVYTWAVLSFGWEQDIGAEEDNVKNLIGLEVQVRWEHQTVLDGATMCHLHIRHLRRT